MTDKEKELVKVKKEIMAHLIELYDAQTCCTNDAVGEYVETLEAQLVELIIKDDLVKRASAGSN